MKTNLNTRKEKTLKVRVFNKAQKDAFLELVAERWEKAEVIGHTKNSIDYQVTFAYTLNFNSFLYLFNSFYQEYKPQILNIS